MASQGVNAASGHADIAQQELYQRRGADHLGAYRVLGPPQGVHEGGGTVGHGGGGEYLADLEKLLLRRATDVAHHFRRIAGVVLLHQVEHATGMLQSLVDLGVAVRPHLVSPGASVVLAVRRIVAREQAVLELVARAHDQGRVGVSPDVLVLYLVVTQQVVDHPAQEGDVRAGANRRIEVRHRCRAVEAGVHYDECGMVVCLGLGDPFEAAGVCLGGIAAHDDDDVGVLDVNPMVGHRAATERRGQTGHRRTVSDPRLVVEAQQPGAANDLVGDPAGFVARGGGGEEACGRPAVDDAAVTVFGNEVLVPVVLHQPGDLCKRLVPGNALPFISAGGAVFRILEPVGAVDEVHQAGALRAQGTPVHRMVRVALDVEDG